MRYCLLFLLALAAIRCTTVKPATGPLILHVWIYYNRNPEELRLVVDSSRLRYTMAMEKETDGCTRVQFSFKPDPGPKRLGQIFARLKRYPGMRGFATTRGEKTKTL